MTMHPRMAVSAILVFSFLRRHLQGIVQEERLHSEKDAAPFDWLKQWYPLAIEADLDPTQPHAELLMGERLVLREP